MDEEQEHQEREREVPVEPIEHVEMRADGTG
jgi:hypothetical protein